MQRKKQKLRKRRIPQSDYCGIPPYYIYYIGPLLFGSGFDFLRPFGSKRAELVRVESLNTSKVL